jgi:adenylyltransferase/sulfurtransferase
VANPGDYVFPELETYVVCRLGNDSQIAADALRGARPDPGFVIRDLVGGLLAWSREVDPEFPVY